MAAPDESMADRLRAGGSLRGEELAGFDGGHFGSQALGLRLEEVSLDVVTAHLVCDERHHQPYGIVHGGVWCAVVESLASIGAAMRAMQQDKQVVGISNSTDFLRAHRFGRVDARAEPVHVGRSQQLWHVVLRREDGKQVARGQVRLQNLDPAQLGG